MEENHIPPEHRKFATETGAEAVESMGGGASRVVYDNSSHDIIHVGDFTSDIPDNHQANLQFGGPNPTIDLFPE